MDIFQRSIHLNAKKIDDDHLLVSSSLLDLEHSFHLDLTVQLSTRKIVSATASMSKAPLTQCLSALANFSQLEGLAIERGIIKEMHSRLGGPKGCTHLVELLTDVIRFTSMLLLGRIMGFQSNFKETMTEEEIIAEGKRKLRNTCIVFADDHGGDKDLNV